MTTKPAAGEEIKPDVMPEIDDDEVVDTPARAEADDGGAEERQPERQRPERYNPREEAVRRYRELRDGANKGDEGAGQDEGEREDAGEEEPGDVEPAANQRRPAAQPETTGDDDPEVELKVHGTTIKMRRSDVIAKAQIALASEDILEEAKRLREDARAGRGQRSDDPENQRDDGDGLNTQDDRTPASRAETDQSKPVVDKEKLTDIVRRLQVGDEEEGQQALADLVEITAGANGGMKPEAIARVVEEQLARTRFKDEIETGAATFQTKYAEIVKDPELRELSFAKLRGEFRDDLVKLGFKASDLANMGGEQLMQLHQRQRLEGKKLRDYTSIFDKVGQDLSSKYAPILTPAAKTTPQPRPTTPAPSTVVTERIERKRSAGTQPRPAGARVPTEPQQKPKSRADVIAEMRRQRGFKG